MKTQISFLELVGKTQLLSLASVKFTRSMRQKTDGKRLQNFEKENILKNSSVLPIFKDLL